MTIISDNLLCVIAKLLYSGDRYSWLEASLKCESSKMTTAFCYWISDADVDKTFLSCQTAFQTVQEIKTQEPGVQIPWYLLLRETIYLEKLSLEKPDL